MDASGSSSRPVRTRKRRRVEIPLDKTFSSKRPSVPKKKSITTKVIPKSTTSTFTTPTHKAKRSKDEGYVRHRLLLNDALKTQTSYEGWSPARIKAYQELERNPNSYYYRFNAPEEPQKTGNWSEEEKQLFLKRKDEVGVLGQWGIFSMAIPGRVGYQCSNFYRKLIIDGEIKDDNYYFDDKGVLRYHFKKYDSVTQASKRPRIPRKRVLAAPRLVSMMVEVEQPPIITKSGRTIQPPPKMQEIKLTPEAYEEEMKKQRDAEAQQKERERKEAEVLKKEKEEQRARRIGQTAISQEQKKKWSFEALNRELKATPKRSRPTTAPTSTYDQERNKRIAENQKLLEALGIYRQTSTLFV